MALNSVIVFLIFILLVNAKIVKLNNSEVEQEFDEDVKNIDDVFNGVYAECFAQFSFPCIQRKTLKYLKRLNKLSEVSVIGEYVKFVKLNSSKYEENNDIEDQNTKKDSEELTHLIDKAIDSFFDNHIIKFNALGRDISLPKNVEEFVGRKKRKGGGGGGGGGHMMMGGGHDGGHFGNKKMMMMAMMCMKMKMMMMLPAMMGMMGMMSFKGMMFSMMSFMVSKMMLLMKILEKKGGVGGGTGGGVGGGDGGWAAGGGGGGAWMPAGGQDFGGGGGGYDANGQWQSRSILETKKDIIEKPVISYITPVVTYNNPNKLHKKARKNDAIIKSKNEPIIKSRRKRSIIDAFRSSYFYWMNQLLGTNNNNRRTSNAPKYKIVNGIKYVFYPYRQQKYYKSPKELQSNKIKYAMEDTAIITAEDFNKGEIIEGAVESRMNKKKMMKMKDAVNETLDDNPWE